MSMTSQRCSLILFSNRQSQRLECKDARVPSSCASSYWDPAFPRLKFHKKKSGGPQSPVRRPEADVQFPHVWFL